MKTIYKLSLLILLLSVVQQANAGINTQSAFLKLYSQRTEISVKDSIPTTRTSYELIFKFNDEKAISLFHKYAVYYSSFETLEDITVFTKNPQPNGKIKTIEIKDLKVNNSKSNSIFYDDEKEVNINFLGLTVGSEAHVNYTVSTNEAHFTEPMSFSFYLPIQERKYELIVPQGVIISLIEKNITGGTFTFEKEEKKRETIYTWIARDIEEDKPMEGAPARMYYMPHVLYKIDELKYNGITYTISKTPRDLFNWYVKSIKHINSKPSAQIKSLADSITKGSVNDKERAKKVYDWVRQNIRYVAFENGMEGLVPREGELVCSRRYGDCKDMSSLQFALLKSLNISVYLTWIGTRRIPYTYSQVPLKNTDNHMIATVKLEDKWYFLDATDPNGIFGIPPDHIQGKQAMVYKNDTEYELIMVPVIDASQNLFIETNKLELEANKLKVKTTTNYKGLLASNIANSLLYMTETEKQDYGKGIIKGIANNAVLNTFNVPIQQQGDNLTYDIVFEMNDYAKQVGDELYLNILLDRTLNSMSIKEPNRKVPYSFKYNSQHEIEYYLKIPLGYKVEYLPENFSLNETNYGGSIIYKQIGNEVVCKQIVYVNTPNLLLDYTQFDTWNKFIVKLNKTYKESIILKKS